MKKLTSIVFSVVVLTVSTAGFVFASPNPSPSVVPEPGTFVLLGLGAAGLMLYKKIKK